MPVATTTPILSKLVTRFIPVATTAAFACCRVAPCTITAAGVPAPMEVSCSARKVETLAGSPLTLN